MESSSSGLRRKDTTKGPPLRILSLDGGGVRGYSMLILLQEFMYRCFVECEGRAPKRHEIPKPCDYFDLIAGTGTGGLIAIMLGRLRLDLETCKDVYVRMTRRVFETDKTIVGIPYRSTLFKASRLEEAMRDCVREHTIFEEEGNDGTNKGGRESMLIPNTPASAVSGFNGQDFKRASVASSTGFSPTSPRSMASAVRWGNPNASLYDARENRTKTAVTAVYKGTRKNGDPVLLRSYDSRKEPPPEFNCSIWQAGRATSAIGLAFKPIQIGQSVFTDEGAGKYNPSPQILDEAAVNEYPGRDVGVFLSIGTGKRPSGTSHSQSEWWEGFMGDTMGSFAEARRRLVAKIEGCEETHQYMRAEHLAKRGVNPENYYRLNVEVGVGEFGMNEWNRLADISTSTRRYISKHEVQRIMQDAGCKMARIERAKRRHAPVPTVGEIVDDDAGNPNSSYVAPHDPLAVELPGDDGPSAHLHHHPSGAAHPTVQFAPLNSSPPRSYAHLAAPDDKFAVLPDDAHARVGGGDSPRVSTSSPRRSHEAQGSRGEAPPIPPKTPIPYPGHGDRPPAWSAAASPRSPAAGHRLPYPDSDGPPPLVNLARKPEYLGR